MQMRNPLLPESPNTPMKQTTMTGMDPSSRTSRNNPSAPTTTTTTSNSFSTRVEDDAGITLRSDSPLDFSFSTKKVKIENDEEILRGLETESTASRLRKILIMKSPELCSDEYPAETVLNLTKGSSLKNPKANWYFPKKSGEGSSGSSSGSTSSTSSCSPPLSSQPAFPLVLSTSEGMVTAAEASPVSVSGGGHHPGSNGGLIMPMTFSPFGPLSPPILSHSSIPASVHLPHPFESQAFYSHHMLQGGGGQGMRFGNGIPMTQNPMGMGGNTNGHNGSAEKSRGTRPFKAYPKDPMQFPTAGMYGVPMTNGGVSGITPESILSQQSNREYADFRKAMLSRTQATRRGGQRNISLQTLSDVNNLSTTEQLRFGLDLLEPGVLSEDSHSNSEETYLPTGKHSGSKADRQAKDEAYWERRRKNNEAAKRSRDARRAKEDEIAIRAVFLEQENMKLRLELCSLRNEVAKTRYSFLQHNTP